MIIVIGVDVIVVFVCLFVSLFEWLIGFGSSYLEKYISGTLHVTHLLMIFSYNYFSNVTTIFFLKVFSHTGIFSILMKEDNMAFGKPTK